MFQIRIKSTVALYLWHKRLCNQLLFRHSSKISRYVISSVTRKNRQMSIKAAKNDFTRKMIDFDTFKKWPKNV